MAQGSQVSRFFLLVVTLTILALFPSQSFARQQKTAHTKKKIVHKPVKAVPVEGESGDGEKIKELGDWQWERLVYPGRKIPTGDWRGEALDYIRTNIPDIPPEGISTFASPDLEAPIPPGTSWTEMGPKPLDGNGSSTGFRYGNVSGRVNAIAFASATTAYAGFTIGGVWKTTNCCNAATTWTPLWDGSTFDAQSVGAIAIDPNNSNIIYAGSGDSQVPHGDCHGNGVYKSTDAGSTWTHYGANIMSPYTSIGAPGATCCALATDQNIKGLVVDPRNSNTVIAGGSFGLFISYDAGVTWTQYFVTPQVGAYADDAQRVTGLVIDGTPNPSAMYVAIGYPYDNIRPARAGLSGGANGVWKASVPSSGAPAFTLMNSGWPAGTGNGGVTSNVGRVELARSPTTGRIYAQVSHYVNNNVLGTWTTANGGVTWTQLTGAADANYTDCNGAATAETQDWYDLFIGVDPTNDHIVYIGRTNLYRGTVNAGYTGMTSIQNLSNVYTQSCSSYGTIHPDMHAFSHLPGSPNFVTGNDGGLYYGTGGVGAFTQLNGAAVSAGSISTNQFYAGQLNANFAGAATQYAFGGMQDNGSASWDSSLTNLRWPSRSIGGDGFFVAFDPIGGTNSAGQWWTEYTYGATSRSTTGAGGGFGGTAPGYATAAGALGVDSRGFSTPFLLDQWNCTATTCNNMILGTSRIWARRLNTGGWTATGAADLTKGTANRYVKYIYGLNVAHSNPGSVIIGTGDGNVQWSSDVFTGANCTFAASNTAAFTCTINAAATWVNLTGSNAVLPNRAINGVAFDPGTNLVFYAAVGGFNTNTPSTPGHIFRGSCSASPCTTANFTWVDKTGALPDIPFEAITVNPNQPNQVFAGSYLGFFYTNDITANPPVWLRYQTGMPNTRISFLTTDRGAAITPRTSTTLAAFTYGRGMYTAQINMPATPRRVPGGTITKNNLAATNTTINWDVGTCAPSGTLNYNLIYGWGSGLPTYTLAGSACNLGTLGTFNWTSTPSIPGGESFMWWIIVESNGVDSEGSWGLNSSPAERNGNVPSFLCGMTNRVNLTCP